MLNKEIIPVRSDNDIQPTWLEILFPFVFNYRLSIIENENLFKFQQLFFQPFTDKQYDSESLYFSIKVFSNKIFQNDTDYKQLTSRLNKDETKRKLLNYMGFFFEYCYYDVIGAGKVMNDLLREGVENEKFCSNVLQMVETQNIPFGQTFGKLVYSFKMFIKPNGNNTFNVKISRKQFKNFAKIYFCSNAPIRIYKLVYALFHCLIEIHKDKSIIDIDNSIEQSLNKLCEALDKYNTEKDIISFLYQISIT